MAEKYSFPHGSQEFEFFASLILNTDPKKFKEIKDFNSKDMEVELKINGQVVQVGSFNTYMNEWYERTLDEARRELGVHEARDAVERRAIKMIDAKCAKAFEIIQDLEDNASSFVYSN